jgi:hypothetical protein
MAPEFTKIDEDFANVTYGYTIGTDHILAKGNLAPFYRRSQYG